MTNFFATTFLVIPIFLCHNLVLVSKFSSMMPETWSSAFYSIVATTIFLFTNLFLLLLSQKCNIVSFSYQLFIAAAFKITIFTRKYLVGGTSNISKNIRFAMPDLLMIPLKLLIPLEIHMLMERLYTIQLTIVQGNRGDTIMY